MALLNLEVHCETTAKYRVSALGSTSTYLHITNAGGGTRQEDGPITVHFNGTTQILPPPTFQDVGKKMQRRNSIVILATGDVEIEGQGQLALVTVVVPDW